MFSQKKKSHTWVYVCAALVIAIIAVFILIGALGSRSSSEDALQTNLEARADEKSEQNQTEGEDSAEKTEDSRQTENNTMPEEKNTQNQFYQSYYLVKYDKNSIKIFFSDETGKMTQLEETTIVYETLSSEDQKRFQEGVKVESRDDLNRLIMDYES